MRPTALVAAVFAGFPLGLLANQKSGVIDSRIVDSEVVGSWRLTIYEADGASSFGLATFGADGTLVTAEHPVVTPPGVPGVIFTSSGHGAWQAAGPETVAFTFVGLGSDGQGNFFGSVTIRGEITLAINGDTFRGTFSATIADPAGNPLVTIPGTIEATRILADAAVSPRS